MAKDSSPKKTTETKKDTKEITPVVKASGRVDSFRELSKRIANGEQIMQPRQLTGLDRRHHVRSTLREDHQTRLEERSAAVGRACVLHEDLVVGPELTDRRRQR